MENNWERLSKSLLLSLFSDASHSFSFVFEANFNFGRRKRMFLLSPEDEIKESPVDFLFLVKIVEAKFCLLGAVIWK